MNVLRNLGRFVTAWASLAVCAALIELIAAGGIPEDIAYEGYGPFVSLASVLVDVASFGPRVPGAWSLIVFPVYWVAVFVVFGWLRGRSRNRQGRKETEALETQE